MIEGKTSSNGSLAKRACILLAQKECNIQFTNSHELKTSSGQYQLDVQRTLESLGYQVQELYLAVNFKKAQLQMTKRKKKFDIFVNLYDLDNEAGQKIVQWLQDNGIPFTGPGKKIYNPTRHQMKIRCLLNGINTPAYFFAATQEQLNNWRQAGDFPFIVKPKCGLDSICIDQTSVVNNFQQLTARAQYVWNNHGIALIEKFIDGYQYTVLVQRSRQVCRAFRAIQNIFPQGRRVISFNDKYGSKYVTNWVAVEDNQLNQKLQKIAKDLIISFQAQGYFRMDIRQDRITKEVYVVDLNPYPVIFILGDHCSADQILKYSGCSKQQFMKYLIQHAFQRSNRFHMFHKYELRPAALHNCGIFATKNIQKDEIIDSDELEPTRIVSSHYLKNNQAQTQRRKYQAYGWPIGSEVFAIWSQEAKKWRPIRHSCDPNCYFNGLSLYARRQIKNGDELTCDYSTFKADHTQFECHCKSKQCRGKITLKQYMNKDFQQRYKGQFSPYIKDLIQRHNEKQSQ